MKTIYQASQQSGRPLRGGATLCAAVLLTCLSCSSTETGDQQTPATDPAGAKSSDEFLIVDCLLPGQVRKLGSSMTYLSPRRPVKTSASDCEIRGGEYVAYDRADYSTALKIWLPLAKEGDPDAQTYVGEIYEKGLGLMPDYELAGFWYLKAVQQGHARAQINLGHLYEVGLGVERDPQKALNLYRQASGIHGDDLLFASTLVSTHVSKTAYDESQAELVTEKQRSQDLQRELGAINQQLATKSRQLAGAEQQLNTIETELVGLSTPQPSSAPSLEQSQRESELLAELEQLGGSTHTLEAQIANLQQENQQLTTQTAQQQQQMAGASADQAQLSADTTAAQDQLRQDQARLAGELSQAKQELADMRHQTLLSKADLQMERFRIRQSLDNVNEQHRLDMQQQETKLAELKQQLNDQYRIVREQRQTIDELEQQRADDATLLVAQVNPAVGQLKRALEPPQIEIIEPPVVLVRSMPTVKLQRNDDQREIIGRVSAPGGVLSLTINGKKASFEDNNLFRQSIPIDVQPKPVEVVVVDKQGRRAKVAFTFVEPTASAAEAQPATNSARQSSRAAVELGDYHALIIGNNDYQYFSTLSSAVNDARETDRLLRERYNFNTKLLLNADRYTILSQLNALREQLDSNDNLLIYFAGHGILDETNDRGYWLPVDADPNNNANWISNTAITDILNVIEAKHILVIADSCFSGTLTQTPLARAQADIPAAIRSEWIKVMSETRARITLTSGGVEPVLDGGGGSHSIFAKAFLDTLRSNDDILEGYSLYYQILDRISAASPLPGQSQVPRYTPIHLAGHESGEFFFNPTKSI